MVKGIISKANFMFGKVAGFKLLFKDVFQQGLPNFWNEQGLSLSEDEYHVKLLEKRNDTSKVGHIVANIKGEDTFDVLDKYFYLFHETRKTLFDLPPITYKFHSELDVINREMLAVSFPSTLAWQIISMFANKWNYLESSSITTTSQYSRA